MTINVITMCYTVPEFAISEAVPVVLVTVDAPHYDLLAIAPSSNTRNSGGAVWDGGAIPLVRGWIFKVKVGCHFAPPLLNLARNSCGVVMTSVFDPIFTVSMSPLLRKT